MSEYQKKAQEMIEEMLSGRWGRHEFSSRDFALLVLDHLVLKGLEVTVSYTQGFWSLFINN